MTQLTPAHSPLECRQYIRAGDWVHPTAALAPGFVQCNLVVLEARQAADFAQFATLNRQACPVIAMSTAGSGRLPTLGVDLDIKTDLPKYRIWQYGAVDKEVTAIHPELWRDDAVSFALGCSFSFEQALMAAGIELRHITEGVNVPMYRTRIPLHQVGPFRGELVVSMRPMLPEQAKVAARICAQYPLVHGAPVHQGDPGGIGIAALERPDFGDPVTIHSGEIPVFWACGVTPQVALEQAKLPWAITHAPGHMLITDVRNDDLRQTEA